MTVRSKVGTSDHRHCTKGMWGALEGRGGTCQEGGAGFVHVWSGQGTEMKCSTNGITKKKKHLQEEIPKGELKK